MGILDDAIREHLELKRKHGVPEEELQRQEEEALGPARRDVAQRHEEAEPTPGQTATAEAEEPSAPAADQETALSHQDTALFDMEAAEATPVEPPPVEPPPQPETSDAPGDAEPHWLEPVDGDEDLEDESSGEREPDDEELLDPEEEPEDPDVLEDTPDFLQETPEHDRLWFEQKPPRDFDFD
jgi:hypothetical protein